MSSAVKVRKRVLIDVVIFAVVIQDLEVDVSSNAVMRGNSAVLRCIVPTFMREYMTVTSWFQDHTFNIYPSSDGGKARLYSHVSV